MKKIVVLFFFLAVLAGCKRVEYTQKVDYHPPKGSDLARVKIVEWSDFECPYCGKAYYEMKTLWQQYGDGIQITYRHFPLTSVHPYALGAAIASECAADQGKFWEYHDMLFENQTDLKKKDLFTYAERLGLDQTLFQNCYDSQVKSKQVRADINEANRLNINSTPTFFVNGTKVEDWTKMGEILGKLLATSSPATVK